MKEVVVGGKAVKLAPTMIVGDGGEAEVYDISSLIPETALKLWMPPNHPHYAGTDPLAVRNREGAKLRLAEYQYKMKAFPKNLPSRVVLPQELVMDKTGKLIVGYTMQLIRNADKLFEYSRVKFKPQNGITNNDVMGIFLDFHKTLSALHASHVVIGDNNSNNALVKEGEVYLIDADSFQFGGFACHGFTPRYVDPLLCDPAASGLDQLAPHNEASDWYAFALMLFESLMLVHPYGGVYDPGDKKLQVPLDARPLKRISVFHAKVRYPAQAVPIDFLPDDVLHFYSSMIEHDERGDFPRKLLEHVRWTKCSSCGAEHARPKCPACATAAPQAIVFETIRGGVTVRRHFLTPGVVLRAALQNGTLRYLYHENGAFKREGGKPLLTGPLMRGLHYRLSGSRTGLSSNGQLVVLGGEDSPSQTVDSFRGHAPMFDSNSEHLYWIRNGHLQRDHMGGVKVLGDVLAGQTWFRVGNTFGFGLSRAGEIQIPFVFDAERGGIKEVQLPRLKGEMLDARCYFTEQRCWFIAAFREGGKTVHHCFLVSSDGSLIDSREGEENDGTWLGMLGTKCAVTLKGSQGPAHCLFALSDKGLMRIQEVSGSIQEGAEFSDTVGLITPEDSLFMAREGLYLVNRAEVRLMSIKS